MANTVTIDEKNGEVIFHVKYGESICGDCHTRQLVDSLNKELDAWRKKASALEGECAALITFVRDIRGQLYDHDMHTWENKADELLAKYWKKEK